jgi:hypothetical protein
MTTHTHQTAPTQFLEAKSIRFADSRFGKDDGVPLVSDINIHFTDTMDQIVHRKPTEILCLS